MCLISKISSASSGVENLTVMSSSTIMYVGGYAGSTSIPGSEVMENTYLS